MASKGGFVDWKKAYQIEHQALVVMREIIERFVKELEGHGRHPGKDCGLCDMRTRLVIAMRRSEDIANQREPQRAGP